MIRYDANHISWWSLGRIGGWRRWYGLQSEAQDRRRRRNTFDILYFILFFCQDESNTFLSSFLWRLLVIALTIYFRHDIYLEKREVLCCSVCTFEKYFLVQYAVKSIDLEDHLRKDHLLMEVQVKNCSLDLNVLMKVKWNQSSNYFTNRTEKFSLGYAKACAPQPG